MMMMWPHPIGFVSDAALQAGGTVHGIIPSALTGRAAERAVKDLRDGQSAAVPSSADTSEEGQEGESKEGTGEKVGQDRRGEKGKFINEIVTTMHEVRPARPSLSLALFFHPWNC
jgi:hypothetical protein